MRVYWRLWHPATHGSLVAVWHRGRILIIRNSYVPYYSLPGGYVRPNEASRDAAVRELQEEVGLHCLPEALQPVLDVSHEWEGKRDHVEIFRIEVEEAPRVRVDHREVIDAVWMSPEEALRLNLFPPLRQHIEQARASSKA
jgi:8-oxo-dGTP diphosphatase